MTSADLSGARDDQHLVQLWLAQRPTSTARVYGPVAEYFLRALGQGSIRDVDASQLITWAEGLPGEPATRARKVSTVKSLLTFAWRTGYCVHNVGRVLRCVRVPSKVHERILEEPELKVLLRSASSGRDKAFARLMFASGCRISELVNLRWLDLAQPGRISVIGKGQKTRTIVVPQKVLDEVLALKPGGATLTDPVFCSKRRPGRKLNVRDARQIIYRARNKAGTVRKCFPHMLRHTHASMALEGGCKLHVLRDSLGHANISTTSTYLHARPTEGSSQFIELED